MEKEQNQNAKGKFAMEKLMVELLLAQKISAVAVMHRICTQKMFFFAH
jgi:hypothetical protein